MNERLFNALMNTTGRKYISDLSQMHSRDLRDALYRLNVSSYSIEEWNYVLAYILKKRISLESLAQVPAFIQSICPESDTSSC